MTAELLHVFITECYKELKAVHVSYRTMFPWPKTCYYLQNEISHQRWPEFMFVWHPIVQCFVFSYVGTEKLF